jgi:hypothetical protein
MPLAFESLYIYTPSRLSLAHKHTSPTTTGILDETTRSRCMNSRTSS